MGLQYALQQFRHEFIMSKKYKLIVHPRNFEVARCKIWQINIDALFIVSWNYIQFSFQQNSSLCLLYKKWFNSDFHMW